MKRYSLRKILEIAKRKSPFYKKLYKDVNIAKVRLADLPIIDENAFWKANSYKNNQLITESPCHGILLKSGGTTGAPKTSVFTASEWLTFSKILSSKLCKAKLLQTDDCVANVFAYGSLYGGFLLNHDVLQESSVRLLELPIGMGLPLNIEDMVTIIKELKANVVMSMPYTLTAIAYYIKSNNIQGINIARFLYGGDLLLDSQYQFIKSIFPKATISSAGYASSDGGFLGYADSTCKMNEYRTDSHFTIMEIVDEDTGKLIEKENIQGKLIVTSLSKALMPVIRYPTGDRAIWCEPKGRKFRKLKLMGRNSKKEDLLTFGGINYEYQDFYEIIKKGKHIKYILGFQILLTHGKLTIKIAADTKDSKIIKLAKEEIKHLVIASIPGLDGSSFEIIFAEIPDFKFFPRSNKVGKIIRE